MTLEKKTDSLWPGFDPTICFFFSTLHGIIYSSTKAKKAKYYGKSTLHYRRHPSNRLAYWHGWVPSWGTYSHPSCDCDHFRTS